MSYTEEQESRLRLAIENIATDSDTPAEFIQWEKEQLALEGIELKEPPVEGYDKGRVISKDFMISESIVRTDPEAVTRMIAHEIMGAFQRTIRLSDWLEANGLEMK